MHAEFFSTQPPVPAAAGDRLRWAHRWISILFTLTVAANFIAMTQGPPPAWITYSPLPFLFLLMATGLWMFARHTVRSARARKARL